MLKAENCELQIFQNLKQAKMENELLEETSSESPCSNLNAFSDQIFREKQESGGNHGNCQIQPPRGGSKKNATQFFLCIVRSIMSIVTVDYW